MLTSRRIFSLAMAVAAATTIMIIASGTALAGDTWLDEHGIRVDNVNLNGQHVSNMTYWIDPPFLSAKVTPNVLFIMDNSGSMNCAAYPGNYDPTQFENGDYYGYFDPRKMYRYTGSLWTPTTDAPGTATTTNPIASGNLLNWATMRRVDVTKKLLNGGNQAPRSPMPGQTVKFIGEVPNNGAYCDNAQTIGVLNNSLPLPPSHLPAGYSNVIYPFNSNYSYNLTHNGLTITPPPGWNAYQYPTANYSIPAGWAVRGTAAAWAAVDEGAVASDGDATHIATTTLDQPALFTNTGVFSQPPVGTISKVSVVANIRQTGTKTQRAEAVLRVKGINYASASITVDDRYDQVFFDFDVNPLSTVAWTWQDVQGLGAFDLQAFGIQLSQNNSATSELRVSRTYLLVTIQNPSGGPYAVVVDAQKAAAETGILGQLSNDARFGLAFYNSDAEGGYVTNYIDFEVPVNMITTIDNIKATTNTPLSETLYNMVRYFRQESPFYHNGDFGTGSFSVRDPYYFMYSHLDGSLLTDQYVSCARSFILMLTDGEPTSDSTYSITSGGVTKVWHAATADTDGNGSRLDNVAYWARTNDMRPGSCTTSGAPWPCVTGDQRIYTYSVFMFGKGSDLLMKTAINGGFEDNDQDNKPGCLKAAPTQDELSECYRDSNGNNTIDPYNALTNPGGDFPLTYYEGNDGYALQVSIISAISDILKRAASGTSVSVLGSSWKGEGAMYQAYFYPEKTEGLRRVKWTGYFQSLFVDRNGLIHEDSNNDGKLTPSEDMVIQFEFITGEDTIIKKFYDRVNNANPSDDHPDGLVDASVPEKIINITEVSGLWDAGKQLAYRDPDDRMIYTSINAATVSPPTTWPSTIQFNATNAKNLRPYLRAKTDSDAANLINFIRGEQLTGWRDRQLTMKDGSLQTWKLGDIVFSDPVVVAAPKERFDIIYNDQSYRKFYDKYKYRRGVVYVGGNDGMLHAFNTGYYVSTEEANPRATVDQVKFCQTMNITNSDCGMADPDRPLGKELWSFIPYDALPHLAWLADPDYMHTYYVDQMVRVTDARIFDDDAVHPDGWGTILLVGMRFGGGEIDVTDDFGGGVTTRQFKSAYYAIDVTDPESPPRLLWRFTDPEMGFSLSTPTILRVYQNNYDSWYAIFTSGPSNYRGGRAVAANTTNTKFTRQGVVSGITGMQSTYPFLYVTGLRTGVLRRTIQGGTAPGYFTNPTVTDYPLDFSYDMVYLGAVYCSAGCDADGYGTWAGNIIRMKTQGNQDPWMWQPSRMFSAGKPITAKPALAADSRGNVWVYFGTGRFLHVDDRFDASTQVYYGIKDPCYWGACTTTVADGTNLLNSNSLTVSPDGTITPTLVTATSGTIGKFEDLKRFMMTPELDGWKVTLGSSERVIVNGFVVGGIAGFGSYKPNESLCEYEGRSRQYFPYYLTGTVPWLPGGKFIDAISVDSGAGLPSVPAVHIDSAGNIKLFLQKSTGEIQVIEMEAAQQVTGSFGAGGETIE